MSGRQLYCIIVLLTYFAVPNFTEVTRLGYAKNPREVYQLSQLENNLVKKLKPLANRPFYPTVCSEILNKYLASYAKAQKNSTVGDKPEKVVENGLKTYKMIFRFVNLFKSLHRTFLCRKYVKIIVDQEFRKANVTKPGPQDLHEAVLGLLRLQYIYGFNATSQLRFGIYGKLKTRINLDFAECLEIAHKAIRIEVNALAYQWLTSAQKLVNTSEQQKELDRAWLTLAWQEGVNCTEILYQKLQGIMQYNFTGLSEFEAYATCRGELPKDREINDLNCYFHLKGNPYHRLNPVKVEVLSKDPLILMYHSFIGNKTAEFLRNSVHQDQYRGLSEVPYLSEENFVFMDEFGEFKTAVDHAVREDIWDTEHPEILKYLDLRIEAVTEMVIDSNDTQFLEYSALGGHYDIHHDALTETPQFKEHIGERPAQFYMFLTDVKMGGNLAFPTVGCFAEPKKGNAVLWFNNYKNGRPDYRTAHTGCPVILGTKQIIRMGAWQFDNTWTMPCELDYRK